ncbi:ABC transporter permease [Sphingomonas sp. 28-62-20]|uniref:ABC transporter permease n=1 Tax=Sphingomonas sp. 28-62-20 TaxID=1970433 RepID=UPI00268E0E53
MTEAYNTYRSFIAGWLIQQSVIKALALREMQTRYGRDNIGFLWMVAEPLMLASVITSLHQLAPAGENGASMAPFPFALIGYCVFIIFRNSFNRAEGALYAAGALSYHAQITPFDIMASKSLVEMTGAVLAFTLLSGVGIMLGLMELPVRPLYLFAAFIAMALMTHGMCMIVAAVTYTNHVLGRFVHAFSYFMFPLSGAFFTVSFLPPWARPVMLWNPMLTIFETARYGMFVNATSAYIYPEYIIGFTMLMWCWGLVSIRNVRKYIHVS